MNNNALAEALAAGRFFWSMEFIPSVDKVLRDELAKLGGIAKVMRNDPWLATFAVTDRVVSERDPEPVAAAANLLDATGKQPLVHFSGKGREMADLERTIERMTENGLSNLLLLTGDRLKSEPATGRARYLESVPAVQAARRLRPDWLLAVALNPFKYREEEAMAQYLKLGKKVGAGANLVITQIGFDAAKYAEAREWVTQRGYRVPMVANVLLLPVARAHYMRAHAIPGITITDSLLALLEAESTTLPDKGASRVLQRLALQIVNVRQAGYAGVQITGLHAPEKLAELERAVTKATADCPDTAAWQAAWEEALTAPDGTRADPMPAEHRWTLREPAERLTAERPARASAGERAHYKASMPCTACSSARARCRAPSLRCCAPGCRPPACAPDCSSAPSTPSNIPSSAARPAACAGLRRRNTSAPRLAPRAWPRAWPTAPAAAPRKTAASSATANASTASNIGSPRAKACCKSSNRC